jgi:hypothetical protein
MPTPQGIQVQPRTTWSDRGWSPGAIPRDEEEPELRQSQDPPGHLRLQALREQGLWGFLGLRRRRSSSAANLCRVHTAQGLRRVRVLHDAHEAPELVLPAQNRTMRRKKALSISAKIAQ